MAKLEEVVARPPVRAVTSDLDFGSTVFGRKFGVLWYATFVRSR